MKKYLIPTAAVVVAAALGTPYYLGVKAEESLTEQQKLLQESGFLTVESHQYDRGWFSSTETTVIRLKPTLLQNTQKYLPDNLKTVLQEPITVINHVTHGPFAGGFGTRAHVETEFQYHPETKKSFRPLLRPANAIDHDQYGLPFRRRQTQPQYSRLRL